MLAEQNIYESQLQLYLKKWEAWKIVNNYGEFLNSFLSNLKKKKEEIEARKIIIKEQKMKTRQEIKEAETKLKKIKNREDKRSFIEEYILPITNVLIKIKNELIDLEIKIKEYKTIKEMKNSEKSINKIKFEKLRKELVDLKIKIEESPLFDGILKQLKQDLKILQEKQNSLLNLKQELLNKDKIKDELQRLENLINLLKQKEKIEVDLQSLKRYNKQLIGEININHKKIEDILNENESVKNKLIDELQESQLIVKLLMKHIETKNKLIADLKTNIKIIDKNLEEKLIKIRRSLDIIVNLQNWRDSIWRRVIVVLTIGLFCSKKSVVNKREKESKKLGEMFKKKQKLMVEQKEKLEQIDVLNRQVEEHKKNMDYNKKG